MASPQNSYPAESPKRMPSNAQLDRRVQDRADNVFTRIEDVTYAVLRRHQKSA